MDNAVKAMYIAAGTLIALMVISVFVYMFRNGARLGHNYEQTQEGLQIERFNNQFDVYSKTTFQFDSELEGYAFAEKGSTASDIITVANLAMTVNKNNDYDERNNLTMHVVCDGDTYSIYPTENQPKNRFVKNMSFASVASTTNYTDANSFDFYDFLKKYNEVRIVDIKGTKNTNPYESIGETIYKYYFDVNLDENGSNPGEGITISKVTRKS